TFTLSSNSSDKSGGTIAPTLVPLVSDPGSIASGGGSLSANETPAVASGSYTTSSHSNFASPAAPRGASLPSPQAGSTPMLSAVDLADFSWAPGRGRADNLRTITHVNGDGNSDYFRFGASFTLIAYGGTSASRASTG